MGDEHRESGQKSGRTPGVRDEIPTSAQLRDDIDSGQAHDKVAKSDPAAAPLGTDDEASGNPPGPDQLSMARRQEAGRSVPNRPSDSRVAAHTATRPDLAMMALIIGAILAAIVLAFVF